MNTTTAKPTPGPVSVHERFTGSFAIEPSIAWLGASSNHRAGENQANAELIAETFNVLHKTGLTPREILAQREELLEAFADAEECGTPGKVSLYDEEGIEGWRWSHPDGREWTETGDWMDHPPTHPLIAQAIANTKGGATA